MPGRKGRRVIENSSNIIKCWFKRAFNNTLQWHFKKDGGILNYLGQESTHAHTHKEEGFFSRILVENSANDFCSLKIVYGVTGFSGCELAHSIRKCKVDPLKLLGQTLRVALLVVVFWLPSEKKPGLGSHWKAKTLGFLHIKGQGMSYRQ